MLAGARPAAGTARVGGDRCTGERALAVGAADHRSAAHRDQPGPCRRNRPRHGGARRRPADVRRLRRTALVLRELRQAREAQGRAGRRARRADQLGESIALREAALDARRPRRAGARARSSSAANRSARSRSGRCTRCCRARADTPAFLRARDVDAPLRGGRHQHLAPLVDDDRWFVQRNAAALLGATRHRRSGAAAAAAAAAQRRARAAPAVSALAGIDDPAAARAVHTVLRAATGDEPRRCRRGAGRRARSARRARCWCASSTRASRSARITRSCSKRSARSGSFGDDQAVPALWRR